MSEQVKYKWEVPVSALERWDRSVQSAEKSAGVSIDIYSTVGEYGDGSGMTSKIVSSVLRKANGDPITVNINSGGGDFFEGLAIHTLLKDYDGEVSVKIVGIAASAASIIALAGDSVEIAKNGFFMIHNAWTVAFGNKASLREIAGMLDKFDASMQNIYSEATGLDVKSVSKMMDAETWMSGTEALEKNFVTGLIGEDKIKKSDEEYASSALRRVDIALAQGGMPRSERRSLIKELVGTPSAADVKPSADENLVQALADLLRNLKN